MNTAIDSGRIVKTRYRVTWQSGTTTDPEDHELLLWSKESAVWWARRLSEEFVGYTRNITVAKVITTERMEFIDWQEGDVMDRAMLDHSKGDS